MTDKSYWDEETGRRLIVFPQCAFTWEQASHSCIGCKAASRIPNKPGPCDPCGQHAYSQMSK